MRKLKTSELNRLSVEEFRSADLLPAVVVLDNIRSAYNVGSVFRTCDAFRVTEIILCGISSMPPNRELMKTALGSAASVKWNYSKDTILAVEELRNMEFEIVIVEQTDKSISLEAFLPEKHKKYAFIFGNEVEGVSENILPLANHAIEIPQFGTKHSLNISVVAGIVLWDFYLKLQ